MNYLGSSLSDQPETIRSFETDEAEIPAGLTGATATIFLSVTLIILTYFLFLNAIGRPARHLAEQVSESVRYSFHGESSGPIDTLVETPDSWRAAAQKKLSDLRQSIEAFTFGYRLGGVAEGQTSNSIRLELNPEETFVETGDIRASAYEPLAKIFSAIVSSKLSIKLEIAASPLPGSSAAVLDAFERGAKRAASLNRLFLDQGGTPLLVSGGATINSAKEPAEAAAADPIRSSADNAAIIISLPDSAESELARSPKW